MASYQQKKLYVGHPVTLRVRVNSSDPTPTVVRFVVDSPSNDSPAGAPWQAIDGALDPDDTDGLTWMVTTAATSEAGIYTWQAVPKVGATISGASTCATFEVLEACVDLTA